jgi:uncharacterized protein (TIGR00255 family)
MALQSMTGFARQAASHSGASWQWEIRSVNGKSLDVRLRLPSGFERLEQDLRSVAAKHVARGNVQASLTFEGAAAGAVPVLNEAAFNAALVIAEHIAHKTGERPSIETLLGLRGVIESGDAGMDADEAEAIDRAILESFEAAMAQLAVARHEEGAAVARVLLQQVDEIDRLTQAVAADPSRKPDAIRARLAEQLERIMGENTSLDQDRLHHEAAILATRADLAEEIDRLEAHVAQARELLSADGAVGRRLDFLAQEFNRECNTICSKSNAASVTRTGLEMKIVIDQFREQLQNLQ